MKYVGERPDAPDVDQALQVLADGCQEANVDDLALVMRQVLVARRGQYNASDHPFIVKSLRKLAPGPDTEATLTRLARESNAFCRLIPTDDQSPQPAPTWMFSLGTPQYIREKQDEDTLTVIVPVRVQKPEHFEKPGLRALYVVFNEPVKTAPTDLKSDPVVNADLNTDKNGEMEMVWPMVSAQQGLTLQAHFPLNALQFKAVGTNGVMRFRLRGVPDKDLGLFALDGRLQVSNLLVFRKSDFSVGDSDAVFQAMVAKLPASEPAK
jgi:hypothetical protein